MKGHKVQILDSEKTSPSKPTPEESNFYESVDKEQLKDKLKF